MPQNTNLNNTPYFDDYNQNSEYYKVLNKPSIPVQAREFNNLQSILQNQIEQFGRHIFKEGSQVIPGQVRYENTISAVEIQSEFNGIPISLYFNNLIGTKIRGLDSNVTAEIVYLLNAEDSERSNYTLYVKYLQSGGENFDQKVFSDGETLLLESPITYANVAIQSGQGFCNTKFENANSQGSLVNIEDGVYFVRGFFAKVYTQTILLDQYGTTPSYKVGFNIIESLISADDDSDLFDNAQGFSNFSAPGADRFKLELKLSKKNIDAEDDNNFVEILRVTNGGLQVFQETPQYNLIRDELARRTYDESGDYLVRPFTVYARETLNDRVLSDGLFYDTQTTSNGNIPSNDLLTYQIGPGKAYVRGYDVETISNTLIDIPKPRTTKTSEERVISYNAGSLCIINNSYGVPQLGLGTDSVVDLMDSRLTEDLHVSSGSTIGNARIYDFVPETGFIDDNNRLFLRLFDFDLYAKIGLTTSITLSTPAHIKGKRSNAEGYLKESVSNTNELTLYSISGEFSENEQIIINGMQNGRLINSITEYNISDVKSIFSNVGLSTFNGDLELNRQFSLETVGTNYSITAESLGISTISAGLDRNFATKIKSGDIVWYTNTNTGRVVFNKVNTISLGGTAFTVSGITSVTGINDGALPSTSITVNDVKKISNTIQNSSSLITKIGSNIESVELNNSEVLQRRIFNNIVFSGNVIVVTIPSEDKDIFFATFDEDRYVISYDDGTYEPLRREMQLIDVTGKIITFSGLSKLSGTANVITTVRNIEPSFKQKKLIKNNTLIVNKSSNTASGIGTTTLNDGLEYSNVYGVRVQDENISLNIPDGLRVLAIYESYDANNPQIPAIQLDGFTGPTNNNSDYILGEQIIGESSGAVGLIVDRIETDKLEFVYLNTNQFVVDEIIKGKDSNIRAAITGKFVESKNITKNFIFSNGQTPEYYGYSYIIRKEKSEVPTNKLKIVFQNFIIKSSDTGEFISVNSYSNVNYQYDIPTVGTNKLTNYLDIRPRVIPYTENTLSPFEFGSRSFSGDGQYSQYILAPDESIILKYNYYLGRIDKIYLNPDGTFEVVQGIPSGRPIPPTSNDSALLIATVDLPPYLYSASAANIKMQVNKRYRMRDISLLEDRISRVENYTTLNALENSVANLKIKDAETGLDRFKCGFFVDPFTDHSFHNIYDSSFRAAIDKQYHILRPKHYTTSLDLQLGSEVISGFTTTFISTKDHDYVEDLGSLGIRKTGDLITLDYKEVLYQEQPYATRTESITPYLVLYWRGDIELHPPEDHWFEERLLTTENTNEIVRTIQADDEIITTTENISQTSEVFTDSPNANMGADPTFWMNRTRSYVATSGIFGLSSEKRNGRLVDKGESYYNYDNLDDYGSDYALGIFMGDSNTITLRASSSGAASKYGFASKYNSFFDHLFQFLPENIVNDFKTKTSVDNRKILDYRINFDHFVNNNDSETTSSISTETIVDTSRTIIPPEVTITESESESISEFTENIEILRSRNIEFDVKGLKPVTRFYSFFENINIDDHVSPKLLEIEMISGTFQIGEVVESSPLFINGKVIFRLCTPNHRVGPHDNPTDSYKLIPYTQIAPPTNYSESSSFLNIDTRALQLPSETQFYGLPKVGMLLVGRSSGATARITTKRLVTDNAGRLIGTFFVPDPTIMGNPKWINGTNTFTVLDVNDLTRLSNNPKISESAAEEDFVSSAVRNITERNILTTRNIRIVPERQRIVSNITNIETTINQTTQTPTQQILGTSSGWFDPLAQSFYVDSVNGVFLTSVDIYFETKDDDFPVTLQIRPMIAGLPSSLVVPFAEVTLEPSEVILSTDSSIPTRFTFPSPVYLNGPQNLNIRSAPIGSNQSSQYTIVLFSNSPRYRVYIAELSENDILTETLVSQQPTLGSLFKSQNGVTWNPTQNQDLKYRLNCADFVSEGLVRFFNPLLSNKNKQITITGQNQFVTLSKKSIVGLGSTGYDTDVVPGVTLSQNSATGKLEGIAGEASTLIISNVGAAYTDGTFTGSLETESGFGQGATASFTFTSGVLTNATIVDGGFGYLEGDSLLIPQEFDSGTNVGFGAKVTVSTITNENAFVINNIQGSFSESSGTILEYTNSSGITTYVGAGVTITAVSDDQYYTGKHMKVYHMNHGMHSGIDYVNISKIRPIDSEVNTTITAVLESNDIFIPVVSSSGFETFEDVAVSVSNPGYALIGEEIIEYISTTATTLILSDTSKRGIDSTTALLEYPIGSIVRKYEFNGISLRRINKTHNMAEVDIAKHPIDFNSYYIKIDTSDVDFDGKVIGTDKNTALHFNNTRQIGKSGANVTNNIQFEQIKPNISHILPPKTMMGSRLRTFSASSLSGNEPPFVDQGFIDVSFTSPTYFSSPKLIGSAVNETRFNDETPGNRSLTMEFLMNTSDSKVSPVIDLINTSIILTTNLVNAPSGILENSTYKDDEFVRSLTNDKHSAIYISNPIFLKIPANSLTVLLSASRNTHNDIRVLYKLYKVGQSKEESYYELFPGYSNYKIDGQGIKRVIDSSQNDGSSDSKVQQSSDISFKDYEYNADGLPDFYAFVVKIVMASENQAIPPAIRDLRAIATVRPKV